MRRLVLEHGLDPSQIKGTGKDGRLTKEDVLAAANAAPEAPAAAPAPAVAAPAASGAPGRREERVKMTRMRQTIAKRLKAAQDTAAMLTTFNDVDMSAVMATRDKYRETFEKKHGVRLGFMSFFTKAVALAAHDIPAVNARIDGDEIVYHDYLDVSVAVSAPNGLVVPVVRNADGAELRRDRKGDRRPRQARQGRHADDGRHDRRHLHHLERRRVRRSDVDPDHQPAAVGGARPPPHRGSPGRARTARS